MKTSKDEGFIKAYNSYMKTFMFWFYCGLSVINFLFATWLYQFSPWFLLVLIFDFIPNRFMYADLEKHLNTLGYTLKRVKENAGI